jgi:hypothetical protein
MHGREREINRYTTKSVSTCVFAVKKGHVTKQRMGRTFRLSHEAGDLSEGTVDEPVSSRLSSFVLLIDVGQRGHEASRCGSVNHEVGMVSSKNGSWTRRDGRLTITRMTWAPILRSRVSDIAPSFSCQY